MQPLFAQPAASVLLLQAAEALRWAHPVVAEWFLARFGSPTEPQTEGWPPIVAGRTTLISAPTGSGKTLAAFLVAIDQLLRKAISGQLGECTEILYISPLKALSNDIQKNLDGPLREIQALALERGYLCPEIRTAVRTGDTLPRERQAMLRRPPHILVTTPESLYILLTAEKSRNPLRSVRTVIVDEIHAIADDKRGAHLVLTLERLDTLVCGRTRLLPGALVCGRSAPPQRIGLSATQNPISLVAEFLAGAGKGEEVHVVSVGQRRTLDLAVEIPDEELSSVATRGIWESIYKRLAVLAGEHRSTLVFVNTRAMVERLAFQLGERLGPENVAAHHGSLSRTLRLEAERKLKAGEIRLLVATASLELGIDIGAIDLVCQINSPRAIAPAMQRVGRAGHWRGATPKGRFFVTTRDDLLETSALVQAMRAGVLDRLEIPLEPLDVLMQQIVAACAAQPADDPWEEDALFAMVRRAYPYRTLPRQTFEELLCLLCEGIASSRGTWGAYLLRDRVHGVLQARRGARLTALSNGGTIPDTAIFQVIVQPEGIPIATLDEHYAIDSSPGDVILLGNQSWRITQVESAGRVLVEDAHGQPPNVPFWTGEAPQRTLELSTFVSDLREAISGRTPGVLPGYLSQADPEVAETVAWLCEQCCIPAAAAEQLIAYIVAGRAVLGAVPTLTTIIAERFFDEGGGMQLILHAPFGGRINKAWGLALRKRFCRGFNFELQAAATDNGLNISLAEQHSFPLSDVFQFLTEQTVHELLQQASLTSPIFKARWRWDACRSLQLLRFRSGKKVPPQVLRSRSDDLLANVFPQVAACQENIEGDIEVPDHPLVREVMKDTLQEAMDLQGLTRLLGAIRTGAVRCLAVDTATPSQFSHELINANPYAFLDDADLEERRTRAVSLRRTVPDSVLGEAGRLSPEAIAEVRAQQWPDVRDEHELHDQLQALTLVPEEALLELAAEYAPAAAASWPLFFAKLVATRRATAAVADNVRYWVTAERFAWARSLVPTLMPEQALPPVAVTEETAEEVLRRTVQGWMCLLGPATSASLAQLLHVPASEVWKQVLRLEVAGTLMRGVFEKPLLPATTNPDHAVEWCDRRLLQRIHKRTLGALRKGIEPVSTAVYMQWLLGWQHVAPQTQLTGEAGLQEALRGLEGFEAPAVEWERTLLPSRVSGYDPRWLDGLCMSGAVGWGRVSPHPAFFAADSGGPRRVIPTSMAPITFFLREEALWLDRCERVPEGNLPCCLSELALAVRARLVQRGAAFAADLLRSLAVPPADLDRALWELVAAGLVTADGFDSLRLLIDPRRRQAYAQPPGAKRAPRHAAGRWSLLTEAPEASVNGWSLSKEDSKQENAARAAGAEAERSEAQLASACAVLLRRYGVFFRDLLERETTMPRWRELLPTLRRMEARGEVRGGRFVSGFAGEQFALPHAVESLREAKRNTEQSCMPADWEVPVAAGDPLNLVGIVVPGERVAAVAGKVLVWSQALLSSSAVRSLTSAANISHASVQAPMFAQPLAASLGEESHQP